MNCFDQYNRVVECSQQMSGPQPWEWWQWTLMGVGVLVVLIFIWSVWLYPIWNVWASHQEGLADLQQAKNEQQVQVAEAQGRLDAAQINKQAAVIEAEAVSAQIKTIGDQLTQHDLYLKWQWIEMMKHKEGSTIYVPTEAGLPILEAGKRV